MLLATTIASQPPFLSSEFSRKAWIFFSPHRGRKRACRAASGYPLTLHSCTPLDFCDHPNGPPAADIHHASLGDAPRCRCSGATATGLSLRNRPLCLDVYSMSLRNRPLSVTQKSSLSTLGNVPRLTSGWPSSRMTRSAVGCALRARSQRTGTLRAWMVWRLPCVRTPSGACAPSARWGDDRTSV